MIIIDLTFVKITIQDRQKKTLLHKIWVERSILSCRQMNDAIITRPFTDNVSSLLLSRCILHVRCNVMYQD